MAEKMRVYQLAKDLNISSKDLITILEGLGFSVKTHMSCLENGAAEQVLDYLTKEEKTGTVRTATEDYVEEVISTEEDEEEDVLKRKFLKAKEVVAADDESVLLSKKKKEEKKKKKDKNGDDFFEITEEKSKNNKEDLGNIQQLPSEVKEFSKKILITDPISVKELAERLDVPSSNLIKEFIKLGLMVNINQLINADNASRIAEKFDTAIEIVEAYVEEIFEEEDDDPSLLASRPPVVTIMGHVDHGKTSLLDVIRHTNVTATEAGGITQSIGAYQVFLNGRYITFVDTPGHEAFTQMRARGADITDIAVLVVAADDGVMPQTLEAVSHARAAKVPIVVAINKTDAPQANVDRVKQQLAEINLLPEDWGGDVITVPVSARKKEGISDLLEMILLVAEMLELKSNPVRKAKGIILEAKLDKHRGPVATVIINTGTLKEGDVVIAGTVYGKVRAMTNYKGERLSAAPPSTPVEILGLADVPNAGDELVVCDSERKAKQLATSRSDLQREEKMKATHRVTLDELFKQIQDGQIKELNIIIKGDCQGSVEALTQSLNKLSTAEVKVNVLFGGVGTVNERDIMLASASNAIIIGFNVRSDSNIMKIAENEKIDIRFYRIIYQVIDDIKAAMAGLLEPIYKENTLGRAEVRATFNVSKVGVIGGSYVIEGKITRNASVRVLRDGVVVYEGKISSLKRFKDDAKEVIAGYECGIGVEKFTGLMPKDIVEAYEMQAIAREL